MTIEGPHAATEEQLPGLIGLTNRVFRSRGETSMGRDFPLLFCEENLEGLRVFTDDGVPVAHVGMLVRDVSLLGTRHTSCAIGAVCTHPDYRGQGLATRLMADAVQQARARGVDLFLISGGRGLYRRLGYVTVGGYQCVTVESGRLPEGRGFRLRPWQERDLPALMRLRSSEPVRFVRGPEDFLTLLRAERAHDGRALTRVVLGPKSDAPLAYVTYKLPGTRSVPEDALTVEELAGSRAAVAHALRGVFDEQSVARIMIECPVCDLEMTALARRHRWTCEPHGFWGTVGIVEPRKFWDACEALFRERLGDERFGRLRLDAGPPMSVSLGDERLPLDGMADLTRLVFAMQEDPGRSRLTPPAGSELADALKSLFPLPLMVYGMNYI